MLINVVLPISPEHITNFSLYMAVLQLLRSTPLVVRHTVCQQVISLLTLNPVHISEMASKPGWESLFLWLLCPLDTSTPKRNEEQLAANGKTPKKEANCAISGKEVKAQGEGEEEPDFLDNSLGGVQEEEKPQHHNSEDDPTGSLTNEAKVSNEPVGRDEVMLAKSADQPAPSLEEEDFFHRKKCKGSPRPHRPRAVQIRSQTSFSGHHLLSSDDDTWRTFAIVTKTIGYILWHYVDQDKPPWMTWGHMFASLDGFASTHKLIVPVHVIKQR